MTANYDSYLVPYIADLAKSLKPYINTGDFLVHKIIFDTAFDQVVKEGGIVFLHNVQDVRYYLLQQCSQDCYFTYTQIDEWFGGKDFQWSIYDKCYQAHADGLVKYTSFDYTPEPQQPEFVKESLDLLTVADIKHILKINGYPTTGKRAELVDRLWLHFPIKDTETLLNQRYQEKLDKYKKSQLKVKYEALARFILRRAYFLRNIARPIAYRTYIPKLDLSMCQADDPTLAKIISNNGYDDVILFNKINRLIPIFPNDFADVRFDFKL